MIILITIKKLILFASLISLTLFFFASCKGQQVSKDLHVIESLNADSILRHHILELSFRHNGVYSDNFFDVEISTVFTSPSGATREIKGFYYNNDVWKVRFRPAEAGLWNYMYKFIGKGGYQNEGKGIFNCLPSDQDGQILRNPANPYRWIYSNGKPYFPIGVQEGVGTELGDKMIDGEGRNDGKARTVTLDEYFSIYGKVGFNLFRFSQKNASYALYDDLDHYRIDEALATDKLLSIACGHGFRVMFGIFGFHENWMQGGNRFIRFFKRTMNNILGTKEEALFKPDNKKIILKEKRFIDYAVARWGVYADFWELLNEREASDEWTTIMADYIHLIDPYSRPVSTSYEKPNLPAIDINAPHWYESESEFQSDVRVQQVASKWKQWNKPVIVGEHGNSGANWDPLSSRRMRIRIWTALFNEISFIFWNTSWSKFGNSNVCANIYLGPEERGYIRVLRDYSSRLDSDIQITAVEVSPSDGVRAFGLRSNSLSAVYLHHFDNHSNPVNDVSISVKLPDNANSNKDQDLIGEWIDPATGRVLSRFIVSPDNQNLKVPSFTIDLALFVKIGKM